MTTLSDLPFSSLSTDDLASSASNNSDKLTNDPNSCNFQYDII